jgi:hypothetical protein
MIAESSMSSAFTVPRHLPVAATPAADTSFAQADMSTFLSISALQQSRSLINEPSRDHPADSSMQDFSSSYATTRPHQPSTERSTFAADVPTLQRVHDIFTLEKAKTFSTRDAWLCHSSCFNRYETYSCFDR